MTAFEAAREARISRSYLELREIDPDAFRRCIEAAGAIAINHGLSTAAAAAVETSMVELVLEVKGRSDG